MPSYTPGSSRPSSTQPSSQSSHLPPRPPPPSGGYHDPTVFRPRTVAATVPAPAPAPQAWHYQPHSPAVVSGPSAPPSYDHSAYAQQYNQSRDTHDGSHTYTQQPPATDSDFDAEQAAAIAQWQSAYATSDEAAANKAHVQKHVFSAQNTDGISRAEVSSLGAQDTGVASVVKSKDGSKSTVVRSGGGKTWQDPTLLEWDPSHFRLFVGNLAGEVTDDSLYKAFSKFPSIQRARVVRDKRSTKSKGFGFVSFSDGDHYFQAAREMNGKYIGSHPIILRKSTTEIKASNPNQQKKRPSQTGTSQHQSQTSNKSGSGATISAPAVYSSSASGAKTGAGVQKKAHKPKGGYKMLG